MTVSSKRIILCADDYAQNDDISQGILCAVDSRRVNAVSCLVNASSWPTAASAILQRRSIVSIGLHFNLTQGVALSPLWKKQYGQHFSQLYSLICATYLNRLNISALKAEFSAQLEAFHKVLGVYPDFIDGHQHIHQLPHVRDAMLEVYQLHQLTGAIRNTACSLSVSKAYVIAFLGGYTLKKQLHDAGIKTNTSFSGVYAFQQAANYRYYFNRFLNSIQDGGLIMCHPGFKSNDKADKLRQSRCQEFDYLMSDAFNDDLAIYGVSYASLNR